LERWRIAAFVINLRQGLVDTGFHQFLIRCAVAMRVALATLGVATFAAAQAPPAAPLSDMVLDCSMHARGGPWVAKELRAGDRLRFGGLAAFSAPIPGGHAQENIFIAFWTQSKGDGQLLLMTLRSNGPRRWLTLMDQARLFYAKGKMNASWQGGTAKRMKVDTNTLLKKLETAPVESIALREVPRTRTVCDSLLAQAGR
jgi:hypothetical protein